MEVQPLGTRQVNLLNISILFDTNKGLEYVLDVDLGLVNKQSVEVLAN